MHWYSAYSHFMRLLYECLPWLFAESSQSAPYFGFWMAYLSLLCSSLRCSHIWSSFTTAWTAHWIFWITKFLAKHDEISFLDVFSHRMLKMKIRQVCTIHLYSSHNSEQVTWHISAKMCMYAQEEWFFLPCKELVWAGKKAIDNFSTWLVYINIHLRTIYRVASPTIIWK